MHATNSYFIYVSQMQNVHIIIIIFFCIIDKQYFKVWYNNGKSIQDEKKIICSFKFWLSIESYNIAVSIINDQILTPKYIRLWFWISSIYLYW